jgi:hypothetical protein
MHISASRRIAVDLTFWIPAMIALGLFALGAIYLFVFACEKV